MQSQYKAFISYSWADKEWGAWVHRSLETYHTPRQLIGTETPLGPAPARLHPIFKDREDEAAGGGIHAAIEAALDASEFLIVVCSPTSAKSQWVNREVAWFKKHKSKERILALVIGGEPGASLSPQGGAECFPSALLYRVGDDLQPTAELEDPPLAADARNEGDGKRGAKLKLAAALLGVGLDTLVRRDERRRTIRRRVAMSGMAAGLAVLSGLTIFAFNQRDAARAALKMSETRHARAEGLIEFMITDMRKRLDAVGRLDVLDVTAQRALEYYGEQDVSEINADGLGRRARAQLLAGEVLNLRGDLDAALEAYSAAAATTEEQLRRDPDNQQRIFDHSQSVYWVGYIAWQRGDAETARGYWSQYHEQAKRLVALDPGNDDWQAELDYSYSNLGTLELDEGNASVAEDWFRKSLGVSRALFEKHPSDVERVLAAGQSYAWLATSLHQQLDLEGALSTRKGELELYDQAIINHPGHTALIDTTIVTYISLAQILIARNELTGALNYSRAATTLARKLSGSDPSSAKFRHRLALALAVQGEVHLHLGQRGKAEMAANEALRLGRELLSADADVIKWRNELFAYPMIILADVSRSRGDASLAQKKYTAVTEKLRGDTGTIDGDTVSLRHYCAALAGSARLSKNANARWAEIIDLLGADQDNRQPIELALLAEAFTRVGKTENAQAAINTLDAAGYRHPAYLAFRGSNAGLISRRVGEGGARPD